MMRPSRKEGAQRAGLAVAQHLVVALGRANGHDGDPEMLQAVHGFGTGVGHVEAERVGGGDRALGDRVGEDRVHEALAREPVVGLGDVAGGEDAGCRRAQPVVHLDPPGSGDPRAVEELGVRFDAGGGDVEIGGHDG